MQFLSLLVSLGFLFNLALAFLAVPPQPSDDDFYTFPDDIASYKEGEIMKWRNPPLEIRALLYPINIQGSWQFMVRSTDSQGQPVGIVGTILQPYDADPSKLLAYNFAEDSADGNCAPSYSILFGADVDTIAIQIESLYMNAALTKGWYVLVTDYEGPNSAFTAGQLSGKATLNAIRAALSSGDDTGISSDAQVAIWGFSGGTIPLSWAGALQPTYAPDLSDNLIGVAVGGWVTNITQVVQNIDGTTFAGFVGAGVLGLASEYPDVQDKIFDLMDPLRVDDVKGLQEQCVVGSLLDFVDATFLTGDSPIFTVGEKLLQIPEIKHMLEDNILARNLASPMPHVPFFVYHGEADEVIPFDNSQRVYNTWCSHGMKSMEFAVSQTSGHLVEFIEGGGAALEWISQRFDGDAPVRGCSRTVRKSNLDYPGADAGFYGILSTTVAGVFEEQLGPLLQGSPSTSDTEVYNILAGLVGAMGIIPFKRN